METKIMFVCAGYGGGIGKMLRFVTSLCVKNKWKVSLLHRGRESDNDTIPQGVEEIVLPFSNYKESRLWRLKEIWSIRDKVKEYKPNLVCCFGSEIGVMTAIALLKMNNIKIIQAQRGDPYTLPKIWAILSKWSYLIAHRCIFQLEKQGIWYGEKIMKKSVIIPNAFIPVGAPIRHELSEKKIVSVGRFVYEKRYEILIKAFKKVHRKHPDYKLVLYGEGPYRIRYSKLIRELGLESLVEMPGYVNNSMEIIKDASVFVLSSLYEGIPNTLIEAMAVGVPTVSTDCTPGGPDFLTNHGRRGILVPVDDDEKMANAICQIIESPELAETLSKLGKEIVSILDEKEIQKKWEIFFEGLLING